MRGIFLAIFICSFLIPGLHAQFSKDSLLNAVKDSLLNDVAISKNDTGRVYSLRLLSEYYVNSHPDSALLFAQQGLELANKMKFGNGKGNCLYSMGKIFLHSGNYTKALESYLKALDVFTLLDDKTWLPLCLDGIANVYHEQGDYRQALSYLFKAKTNAELRKGNDFDIGTAVWIWLHIALNYEKLNKLDSGLFFVRQAYAMDNGQNHRFESGRILYHFGTIYSRKGNADSAMTSFRQSLPYLYTAHNDIYVCKSMLGIAKLFEKTNQPDSCLAYAKKALTIAKKAGFALQVLDASTYLTDYFKRHNAFDSAFVYQQIAVSTKDSLFSRQKIMDFQSIAFNEKMRQKDMENAKTESQSRLRSILLLGGLLVFLLLALILWRNNRQKQRANSLLNLQKKEIDSQKDKIEKAFHELKSAQTQLIQSEKMASLGELTAGIAHEIQNPLNFINNFSEVSNELIREMVEEVKKGNTEEVKTIASDLVQNLEKINHHGKRADAIVKGMLLHSRGSVGAKEPTDINALCDEYMRLTYHGLRAKNKSFNASIKTGFDHSLEKINIIPQDIGRVILNLLTNAFYAVNEKKQLNSSGYEPTVSISTKKIGDKVEIKVRDNGNGIPQRVLGKIFQPFFTTKPSGQGTGLGLSLSYDIIKANGGELKVETREGEGTDSIIILPAV